MWPPSTLETQALNAPLSSPGDSARLFKPFKTTLPPLPPLNRAQIVKRVFIWAGLVSLAAAPSFVISALSFGDEFWVVYPATLLGIATYIVGYTWYTCRHSFRWRWQDPTYRTTLYIGYGTRCLASVVYPVGALIDFMCGIIPGIIFGGIISMLLVPHSGPPGFFAQAVAFGVFYLWTLAQGLVLNILLMIYMAMVYAVQRPFRPRFEPNPYACLWCGYDLRASERDCPECGTPIPEVIRGRVNTAGFAPAEPAPVASAVDNP